ncbi:hypothetical protein ymoll0001_28160 [Yersinia mollaretii ATCC 43969]|uniref:Transposase n=1 Tax=Yersinia mollaretii (strain ATCC 43969 / DSM 18520 / CIP 103324 / CNY 7263 / WAIP 204) TaxID=349967 RepID=A0ABP2EG07_YERMW|nr:hypothetical protein ymoll0001_28160 [Yersinia mollaretii ATCC 43969]
MAANTALILSRQHDLIRGNKKGSRYGSLAFITMLNLWHRVLMAT